MEACRTSQFEQHVRAICNLPLGSTELMSPVVMVNLLGEHIAPLQELIDQPDFLEHERIRRFREGSSIWQERSERKTQDGTH